MFLRDLYELKTHYERFYLKSTVLILYMWQTRQEIRKRFLLSFFLKTAILPLSHDLLVEGLILSEQKTKEKEEKKNENHRFNKSFYGME